LDTRSELTIEKHVWTHGLDELHNNSKELIGKINCQGNIQKYTMLTSFLNQATMRGDKWHGKLWKK